MKIHHKMDYRFFMNMHAAPKIIKMINLKKWPSFERKTIFNIFIRISIQN